MKIGSMIKKTVLSFLFGGMIAVGATSAAMAKVVSEFRIENLFGSNITLDTANCTVGSISAPSTIFNGNTAVFTGTGSGSSLLCTVRYHSGIYGCQFQVWASSSGFGWISSNAYKGSGGSPWCPELNEGFRTNGWWGHFAMQP